MPGAYCGDKVIDSPPEQCDDGAANTDTCTPDGAPCSYCDSISCTENTIAAPVVTISDFIVPACVVSGDDSKPVASWISNGDTCEITGTDVISGAGSDTVPLFSSPNTAIDPISPLGIYKVVLICKAKNALDASMSATFDVEKSCSGVGGGTSAPIQPVYIDS